MNFFKSLLAAFIGTLIAILVLFLVMIGWLSSSAEQPEPYIRSNSILTIELSGSIPDRSVKNPLAELFPFAEPQKVDKVKLRKNLRKANSDDRVSGVLVNFSTISDGWASLQEVHSILKSFADSSDKFIYSYTDDIGYNEKAYYLATATDSIYSPPESFFEFDGFYTETTFYTGMLDKLGIEPELAKKGKYKSAVEPYYRKENSDNSEYQLEQILKATTDTFVEAVIAKTGKSSSEINELLSALPTLHIKPAYQSGLIDRLYYQDELYEKLENELELDSTATLETVELKRYDRVSNSSANLNTIQATDKIAVLYASGMILPQAPSSFPGNNTPVITATNFREDLEEIREDKDIKALVVRVNSPGGSGTTSDLIWRMLRETSKEMPVIASMGNVAASGGYYIAMAADTIVAHPTTITGSIGVFSTKFNARELLNDKVGITFDRVKTHEHADWLNGNRSFTEAEAKAFQRQADNFYQTFITKAALGRPLSKDEIDQRGQGRVWIGTDALNNKLVDVLGDLPDAVQIAADKAGIKNYKVASYPKPKPLYEVLMQQSSSQVQAWLTDNIWPAALVERTDARDILRDALLKRNRSALTWLPYQIEIQ